MQHLARTRKPDIRTTGQRVQVNAVRNFVTRIVLV
jgi:hypothetical protein